MSATSYSVEHRACGMKHPPLTPCPEPTTDDREDDQHDEH